MAKLDNPTQIPAASVPAGPGLSPNPAWVDLVNSRHELAHNTLSKQRDVLHNAGRVGYVDASGQAQGQSTSDQQAFVSVPRPPDTQSY